MNAKFKITLYLLRSANTYAWSACMDRIGGADTYADVPLVGRDGFPVITTPSDEALAKLARHALKASDAASKEWVTKADIDAAEVWIRRGKIADQKALNDLRQSTGKFTVNFGDPAEAGFAARGTDTPAERAVLAEAS